MPKRSAVERLLVASGVENAYPAMSGEAIGEDGKEALLWTERRCGLNAVETIGVISIRHLLGYIGAVEWQTQ